MIFPFHVQCFNNVIVKVFVWPIVQYCSSIHWSERESEGNERKNNKNHLRRRRHRRCFLPFKIS